MNDEIERLHAEGHTYLEIAKRLGVSRNVIAGRVHRMGLCHKSTIKRVKRVIVLTPELAPPSRPAPYYPTKRDLYYDLRKAVENTK
jgi:hypothetical protein